MKKNTQRRWARLQQAILFAPEMSSLLLTRYLDQGTAWTDVQIQALRQGIQEHWEVLTWRHLAALEMIEQVGILRLLRSFQIPIHKKLCTFFEKADKEYKRIRPWHADVVEAPVEQVFAFVQQYGGEWRYEPCHAEMYPFLRALVELDTDALHQRILRVLLSSSAWLIEQGGGYLVWARCLEALEALWIEASNSAEEGLQIALFGVLSRQKYVLRGEQEQLLLCLRRASDKVKRAMVLLFLESPPPEALPFFWDQVIEAIVQEEGVYSSYQLEKMLEGLTLLPLPSAHQARLREVFFRLPFVLQVRFLPKIGEDPSPEAGEILLRCFFGKAADLCYASSQGIIRYLEHHPAWLGRLIELEEILAKAVKGSVDEPWGMAVEDIISAFAKTTGDWASSIERTATKERGRGDFSLFAHFRTGRALIARWIGESRLVSYLPLLRGWFCEPSLDAWEKAEIALALARLKDQSIVSFLIKSLPSLSDIPFFSDPLSRVFLAAHALLSDDPVLLGVYRLLIETCRPKAEKNGLLVQLLLARSLPTSAKRQTFDTCLAQWFVFMDLFSKPLFQLEREIFESFQWVLNEIFREHRSTLRGLGEGVCVNLVAYTFSRLRFLPRKPWVQESVDAVTQILGALCGADEAFLAQQRQAYEASLFS